MNDRRDHQPSVSHPHRNKESLTVSALATEQISIGQHATRLTAAALPCRSNPADLWFAESPADVEDAKRLCASCPLVQACLAGALERREPWGVWGGELFVQGQIVARKRPRGRPRKNPVAA